MTRSQRQTLQLIAVGLLVVIVVGWFVAGRGSSSSGTISGAPSVSAVAKTPAANPTAVRPATTAPSNVATKPVLPQTDPASGLRLVAESALPKEARETLRLIRAGGPYPYPRNDDKTFNNAERLLPRQVPGYYREYTVITPGSADRGARRIIAGRSETGDRVPKGLSLIHISEPTRPY